MFERKPIRIVIVDDNKILREAWHHIFKDLDDMKIVGEAGDGFEAIDLAKKAEAKVMLLEPMVPRKDGIDLTREITAQTPSMKVLILTLDQTPNTAFRMLRAGALGWLPKTCGTEEVLHAIRLVARGKIYLPGEIQSIFAEKYLGREPGGPPEEQLSDREYQVMRLLALGHTNREIAKILFIGTKTVDTHRANLLRKLELRNNSDITRFAIQHGFIRI